MDLMALIDKGGVVVWILLGYSTLALAIVLERYIHFIRMGRLPAGFAMQLQEALSSQQLAEFTINRCGPEIALINAIYQAAQQGVHDLVRVATRIGSFELQRMERGFRTLGLLGDTAPLLGLLGTITGMIKAFIVIEQAGGKVDAQALAGGIWEAMITTGVGLAVAIPILFLLHWLEGKAASRHLAMQQYASLMIEYITHSASHVIDNQLEAKGSRHAV